MPAERYLVFDCESIGLHGDTFAWGGVVVDTDGQTLEERMAWCDPDVTPGDDAGRVWVMQHAPLDALSSDFRLASPRLLRDGFWDWWQQWATQDVRLVADCGWPVETHFLSQCVADDPNARAWQGPYPLHEVATSQRFIDVPETDRGERLPNEQPEHHPLMDARQSARIWLATLGYARQRKFEAQTWEALAREQMRTVRERDAHIELLKTNGGYR